MRTGVFTVVLVLFLSNLSAQNALFLPFGFTKAEVDTELAGKDYIKEISKFDQLWTVTVSEEWKVEYYFQNDRLFAVKDFRKFENNKQKKSMESTTLSVLDFMKKGDNEASLIENQGGVTSYGSMKGDQLFEFVVDKDTYRWKKETELVLKVTSRKFGPRRQTDELATMISRKTFNK